MIILYRTKIRIAITENMPLADALFYFLLIGGGDGEEGDGEEGDGKVGRFLFPWIRL